MLDGRGIGEERKKLVCVRVCVCVCVRARARACTRLRLDLVQIAKSVTKLSLGRWCLYMRVFGGMKCNHIFPLLGKSA